MINPWDNFPFKKTIAEALLEIPMMKKLNKEQDLYVTLVLNALQLLVEIRVTREDLDSKFPKYKNVKLYKELDENILSYIKALPTIETMDLACNWEDDELKFYSQINFQNLDYRMKSSDVFHEFVKQLKNSSSTEESEYLLSNVFVSEDQYKWAFSAAQSRTFTLYEKGYIEMHEKDDYTEESAEINKQYLKAKVTALVA